ncbi:beta strand repeat-containing protein [Flavobacterium phragmitis]|uniref:Head domain of trimeric autotransporter adhesin n=1 Tax=Flavobacterium phragmitis TaxID=739143 RepID=A0A1I1TB36_9FLAO|nr:hypothetical protein [Flavobacterium phragmitis]SFD53523.1 hypothetical protein SAMN05216297_1092 [Flavobacterium phragmitis]
MKKIIYMLLLIQSGFMMAQTKTVVTPNGEKVTINPFVNNGLSTDNGYIQLGGPLTRESVLTTTSAFTLAIKGLGTGTTSDNILVADPTSGVLKYISASSLSGTGTFWSLSGNGGTDPALNFLGTTDDKPLRFKIESTNAGALTKTYTAFGYNAYNAGATGAGNTAIGISSLNANTTGWSTTAIGFQALMSNTTGASNTAVGSSTLSLNSTGSNNTALGSIALQDNTTGGSNTALGASALTRNQTGDWNTAVGSAAVSGNTTGYSNTGVGHFALYNNTTGNQNTSVGDYALRINTTGNNNTAIGYESGRNIGGNSNVAIGNKVLTQDTTTDNVAYSGDKNIAIGDNIKLSSKTAFNELNIGNALFGTNVNSTIGTARIGVNTQAPGTALHVKPVGTNDPLTVEGLKNITLGTEKVIVTGTDGVFKTVDASSLSGTGTFWSLSGNGGTTSANFLGTTDNNPLRFKINSTNAGILSQSSTAFGYNALNPSSSGTANTAIGDQALTNNTNGSLNVAIGSNALQSNNGGSSNNAVGYNALKSNKSTSHNNAFGASALENFNGSVVGSNSAFGSNTLKALVNGNSNSAFGFNALTVATSSYNTAVGHSALLTATTGANNTAMGYGSFQTLTTGGNNTGLGYQAGFKLTGNNNIALGNNAGYHASNTYTGDKNILIGDAVNLSGTTAANELNIGNALFGTNVNSTIGTARIGVNTQAPGTALHVKPDVTNADPLTVEGIQAGTGTNESVVVVNNSGVFKKVDASSLSGSANAWNILGNTGTTPGTNFVGTNDNNALAFRVNKKSAGWIGTSSGTGASNFASVYLGQGTTPVTSTGDANVGIGAAALGLNTSGNGNTAVGAQALRSYNSATNGNNTAVGYFSLKLVTDASNNTGIGVGALQNTTTGGYNTALGVNAGTGNTTGTNNIFIGSNNPNGSKLDGSASNEMNIGNLLYGTGANQASTTQAGRIGINTNAPTTTFHIYSKAASDDPIRVEGLKTGAGSESVVVVDNTGVFKKVDASSLSGSGWSLLGNSGTTDSNFLGTADDRPFYLRINNANSGSLSKNNTAFGYNAYNTTATASAINNTAVGLNTLSNNSIGVENTALGSGALKSNTNGSSNIAIGIDALGKNTSGNYNAIVGYQAMSNGVLTGNYNAAFGYQSLFNNAGGNHNVALGEQAGYGLKDGNLNVYLGYRAGYSTTDYHGNNNILIGAETLPSSPVNNDEINIGNAIYGLNVNNSGIGYKSAKIGINTPAPNTALHVVPKTIGTDDPLTVEGLKAGAATDKFVVVDPNGVFKSVDRGSTGASMRIRRVTAASATLVDATDDVLLIDATGAAGPLTITVPACAAGRVFTIKRVDSVVQDVKIIFAGGATVDETDTFISVGNKTTYQIITEGANNKWQTISRV